MPILAGPATPATPTTTMAPASTAAGWSSLLGEWDLISTESGGVVEQLEFPETVLFQPSSDIQGESEMVFIRREPLGVKNRSVAYIWLNETTYPKTIDVSLEALDRWPFQRGSATIGGRIWTSGAS